MADGAGGGGGEGKKVTYNLGLIKGNNSIGEI